MAMLTPNLVSYAFRYRYMLALLKCEVVHNAANRHSLLPPVKKKKKEKKRTDTITTNVSVTTLTPNLVSDT